MSKTLKPELKSLEGRLGRVCAVLDDHKGEDITVLDLRGLPDFSDAFVLVTTRSRTHMQGLAHHLIREMRTEGLRALNPVDARSDRWLLIDFGDVVVHLFDAEGRAHYDLEALWGDAEQLDWQELATA